MAIRSPLAARVEYRLVEPGTVIGAGSRVISLLDPADVYMNVFLPNVTVSGLRVGDEARIVLDGIDAVLPAQVSFIASDAQFTPKAVETANEREKLVFRVKLKVPSEVALRSHSIPLDAAGTLDDRPTLLSYIVNSMYFSSLSWPSSTFAFRSIKSTRSRN